MYVYSILLKSQELEPYDRYILSYLPDPSARAEYDTRSIF